MIRRFFRLVGVIQFAFERLVHHPGLTFLALLGVVLAVGLVSNASFFAQAVDQVILNRELAEFSEMTGRPPFSTAVYTFPSAESPISLSLAEELAQNVAGTLSGEVGLPVQHIGLQVHSGNMMLQPPEGETRYQADEFLGAVDVAYIRDIADHMAILLGEPLQDAVAADGAVPVWMHTRLAEKMGINPGDELRISLNMMADTTPVRVMGIWKAKDPDEDFWFENPDATLQNVLLVRRDDYIQYFQPLVPAKSWYVSWHIILDGSKVYPDLAQEYLQGFVRAETIINKYLPKARINTPPLDPLKSFVTRGDTLTVILLSFNLPAFGFLLYFLMLSSGIIAQWQQRETALLVGRGMRPSSILTLTLFEELLLFIVGYPLGLGLGGVLARLMGNTASFLSFTNREPLPISMRGLNVPVTLVALAVALVARMLPAAKATRMSAIEVDRAHARPSNKPFWYRAYLDLLLALPTYYAYRQLMRRGSLAVLVQDSPADLYQDPLLILVPALFILTVALLSLRIFPLVMQGLDMVASLIPWSTPHLALRQLARRSHTYISPLLLVIVSLALGVYTLSMAASMDQWLIDRMYYSVGSDLRFSVLPISLDPSQPPTVPVTGEWIPTPADFETVPGIAAATPVGDFSMSTKLMNSGEIRGGRFLAVDRLTFPRVAWFRKDFASESLGALMNRLAASSDAILVSEEIFKENQLRVGDKINVNISVNYEIYIRDSFTVVGTFKYFPTVDEDERVTFIGNLSHLDFYVGLPVPRDMWVRLEKGATGEEVLKAIPTLLRVETGKNRDALALIQEEQSRFERVGVFGTLTVGFLAAVVMAVMGLLIYTYASLRERLYRFTVLRAIGLLRSQITGQVVMEYAFLTAFGAITGGLIGSFASQLFVPMFRITGEQKVPLPPLIPIIAIDQVRMLVTVFVGLIILLEVLVISQALSKRAFSMLKGVFG